MTHASVKQASTKPASLAFCVLAYTLSMGACAQEPSTAANAVAPAPAAATESPVTPAGAQALPVAIVHKSPTCGCCGLWVEHLRHAGFQVEVRETDNLAPVKERLGVPFGKGSCHTAEIGGYLVEGHVPADDIKRLLREKPQARGLVLPGMPLGSPGMEVPSGATQSYVVELVKPDGDVVPYAAHGD